jgi:hypothetical protein
MNQKEWNERRLGMQIKYKNNLEVNAYIIKKYYEKSLIKARRPYVVHVRSSFFIF